MSIYTDLEHMSELEIDKPVKVSLPDGRALIIERGSEYVGAFIGLVDKERVYHDMSGVELYDNYQCYDLETGKIRNVGEALVTHTWDVLRFSDDPKDIYATMDAIKKDEQNTAHFNRIAAINNAIADYCKENLAAGNSTETIRQNIMNILQEQLPKSKGQSR